MSSILMFLKSITQQLLENSTLICVILLLCIYSFAFITYLNFKYGISFIKSLSIIAILLFCLFFIFFSIKTFYAYDLHSKRLSCAESARRITLMQPLFAYHSEYLTKYLCLRYAHCDWPSLVTLAENASLMADLSVSLTESQIDMYNLEKWPPIEDLDKLFPTTLTEQEVIATYTMLQWQFHIHLFSSLEFYGANQQCFVDSFNIEVQDIKNRVFLKIVELEDEIHRHAEMDLNSKKHMRVFDDTQSLDEMKKHMRAHNKDKEP